ncbi:MAG: M48 family metalloprotease [Xanthobacteraceae bacterium]|nr:M48 family metalloprotease [Xanthobacteraceae bacterium]
MSLIDPGHAPFLGWSGYAIRYAPVVLAASVLWFGAQMFWHIETVKRAVDFHFIDDAEEPRLCRVIEPLIITMGLPVPYVAIVESRARNAFACGIARKKAAVVVTRGLIDSLDDEELACVLAHELSHIRNGDIRLMAAANIFMSALTRLHRNNGLRMTPVHALLAIAIPVILPLTLIGTFVGHLAVRAGQIARLLISSSREYIADAEAVQLTKNPAALASALVKVESNYRVGNARHEDDAMMIAGDTHGRNATHPTVAQRIAALARTTGSMVFNAPSAPRPEAWANTPSLAEAESAALLRKLPQARVLPRISADAPENIFGLTRIGMVMTAATIIALLLLHAGDLGNPRALAAKFDIRPLGIMLSAQNTCQLRAPFGLADRDCTSLVDDHVYRDFEGQKNTLVGWLADLSRKRREAGVVNADLTFRSMTEPSYVRRAYRGQSGRLEGTMAETTDDGLYEAGYGKFSSVTPERFVIAEIEKVSCFPAKLMHGKPEGSFRMDQEISGGISFPGLVRHADESLVSERQPGTPGGDDWLRAYARTREMLTLVSYDIFGLPGLQKLRAIYRNDAHRRVVDLIRQRLSDPAFTSGLDVATIAKIKALARAPDRFVPCPAVKRGALEAERANPDGNIRQELRLSSGG